ncbi:cysteine dioxygenase family protein [Hazenella sp. IB182357]|uniref:Cysteine dioxygenase family protein n=1 Tax=Polycladospora coralii TaxID=2771432 RepID=A0A926NA90_9BACL|nr:cysteine dioxygenase family protein [Polycladospora coralii]MBD1371495.1 cysteine dioxygenase family protein [Polycladospora coralii]MBS7528961.1 cysteine dioxygenase family protein [Polycladospora coralii]
MSFINQVEAIIQHNEQLDKSDRLDLNQLLKKLVVEGECTFKNVVPHQTKPVSPLQYGRNVIFQSELYEVVVISMPALIETPIHDHGESDCCAYVVSGLVENRCFSLSESAKPLLRATQYYHSGEYFYESSNQIHSMKNPTGKSFTSLHLYSPPIKNNTIYKTVMNHKSQYLK